MTGASGALLAFTVLKRLSQKGFDTVLLLSDNAVKVAELELAFSEKDLEGAAKFVARGEGDLMAESLSSLIIVPCSVKTLAGIAWRRTDNLILKVANRALDEGVRTVLVVRETPWSLIHLRNMMRACERGAVIMPPTIMPKLGQKTLKDSVAELADRIIEVGLAGF